MREEKEVFYEDHIRTIESFTHKLMDEESLNLYDVRFRYFFDRDRNALEERIMELSMKYKNSFFCWGLNKYFERYPDNKGLPFVVFAGGNIAGRTVRTLLAMGLPVRGVVDNNQEKWGEQLYGHTIENPETIKTKYRECVVVVDVPGDNQIGVYHQLFHMGVLMDRVYMPASGGLYCDFGIQYFDLEALPADARGEIFVDAGCFNGDSSVKAAEWAKGSLQKVYAFEPDKAGIQRCEGALKKLGCEYELYNIATWSGKQTLFFESSGFNRSGSKTSVSADKGIKVEADSIDNILQGSRVTYIKLDVEGSELETLRGAVRTIKKYKPRLAISVYHKPEDIIEIPLFMESLEMDYKYYIRQYQTRWCETTLYAI